MGSAANHSRRPNRSHRLLPSLIPFSYETERVKTTETISTIGIQNQEEAPRTIGEVFV